MNLKTNKKVLGSFALTMISISAILSLRSLPLMASVGWQALFFYGLAGLLFLLPSSLVCAELATSFPEGGGVYTWVRTAFGDKFGVSAIWMEWINNVIAFPTTLAMIVATIAYIGFPELAANRYYLFALMMVVFWGLTFYNFLGIRAASGLNIIGALFGTLLPGGLIIILGVSWLLLGKTAQVNTTSFLPDGSVGAVAFFVAVLSAYSGMQVTAFHAKNVSEPARNFPRAILFSGIIIFLLSTMAALSIAVVVPHGQINLINGVIQTFANFFKVFGLSWFTPILAALIALGAMASLSAWILAPARGIQKAAKQGDLPPILARVNRQSMPWVLLLIQAVTGTVLSLLFLFMPSLKQAFWVLLALTSQFTVLMYILVFLAVVKLRLSQPNLARGFSIPGGSVGVAVIAALGIISCAIGFGLGLFAPKQLGFIEPVLYSSLVVVGDLVIIVIPILYLWLRKPRE